jgi:hypothetical protein
MLLAFVLLLIDFLVFAAIIMLLWQCRTSHGGQGQLVHKRVCAKRNQTKGRSLMSDNKTDWSKAESLMGNKNRPAAPVPTGQLEMPEQPLVPHVLLHPITELNHKPGEGFVGFVAGLHGEGRAKKHAAIRALTAKYNAEIDMLEGRLTQLMKVQKVQAEVVAEEYLSQLDARKLEVLTELGIRNVNTRQTALVQLTNTTVAKIKEVQALDWPEPLKERTIHDLLALLKRFNVQVMEELGTADEQRLPE